MYRVLDGTLVVERRADDRDAEKSFLNFGRKVEVPPSQAQRVDEEVLHHVQNKQDDERAPTSDVLKQTSVEDDVEDGHQD